MEQSDHEVERWIGQELVDVDGQPIGTIDDIYLDAATEQPEWLAVKTSALNQAEEAQLYDHYGLVYGQMRSGSGLPEYEDDAIEVPVERVAPVESSLAGAEHEVVLYEEQPIVEGGQGPRAA